MSRPLIIGFGNPLREDDGLGWRVAELLRADSDGIDILQCQQLTPELAEDVVKASLVIFLDAALDQEPGSVSCELVSPDRTRIWTHHLSPAQLMGLAGELADVLPAAYLVSGGARSTGWSETLAAGSQHSAECMADAARGLLLESVDSECR